MYEATDAEDAHAVCVEGDPSDTWRVRKGFGQKFKKVWSVELQSKTAPAAMEVDWDAVLERAIEAYDLSDPVLTNFEWPRKQPV